MSEKEMLELESHPAANLFPMMGADEMKELSKDIKERGLLNPIVLCDGLVLDGRNRYLACRMSNIQPHFVNWRENGLSPTEWVLSVNLHRRHLTASQKAAIATKSLPLLEAEAKQRQVSALKKGSEKPDVEKIPQRDAGRSVEKAAKAVGVNPRYISDAKAIKEKAPEQFEKIVSGEKTISQVKTEMKKWEQGLPEKEPAAHAPEDNDSDTLFTLKSYWKKATKKDRSAFLQWVDETESKTKSK